MFRNYVSQPNNNSPTQHFHLQQYKYDHNCFFSLLNCLIAKSGLRQMIDEAAEMDKKQLFTDDETNERSIENFPLIL
jgi:hypothetical protein